MNSGSGEEANEPDRRSAATDGFIRGGYRPSPVIPDLPPIQDVEFGTVYQDAETGTLWKAVPGGEGSWLKVEVVTATEHAAVKKKRLTYILVLVAAVVFAWLFLGGILPQTPAPWSFLVPLGLALVIFLCMSGWLGTAKILAARFVAPGPGDDNR